MRSGKVYSQGPQMRVNRSRAVRVPAFLTTLFRFTAVATMLGELISTPTPRAIHK